MARKRQHEGLFVAPKIKKQRTTAAAKRKATRPAPSEQCPRTGPMGAIHYALATGDFEAYRAAMSKAHPHGHATKAQFAAAVAVLHHVELAMLNAGPLPAWLATSLAEMGKLARGVDTYDALIEGVVAWCEALLRVQSDDPLRLAAHCAGVQGQIAELWPAMQGLDPFAMGKILSTERAKVTSGPNALAAALFAAAGIKGKRGRPLDKTTVAAAVSRARASRVGQNEIPDPTRRT
jgi:hypothetical protein